MSVLDRIGDTLRTWVGRAQPHVPEPMQPPEPMHRGDASIAFAAAEAAQPPSWMGVAASESRPDESTIPTSGHSEDYQGRYDSNGRYAAEQSTHDHESALGRIDAVLAENADPWDRNGAEARVEDSGEYTSCEDERPWEASSMAERARNYGEDRTDDISWDRVDRSASEDWLSSLDAPPEDGARAWPGSDYFYRDGALWNNGSYHGPNGEHEPYVVWTPPEVDDDEYAVWHNPEARQAAAEATTAMEALRTELDPDRLAAARDAVARCDEYGAGGVWHDELDRAASRLRAADAEATPGIDVTSGKSPAQIEAEGLEAEYFRQMTIENTPLGFYDDRYDMDDFPEEVDPSPTAVAEEALLQHLREHPELRGNREWAAWYEGVDETATDYESAPTSDAPPPSDPSAPEVSPAPSTAPTAKFTPLTAEQVVEAETTMARLDEQASLEGRRFTPDEVQQWQAAHDSVVADTMIKAGLEPEPDGKLPSYVWDQDNGMWRPDTDGVNPSIADPVQYEIEGRELPLGFLVPTAKSVQDACATVGETQARLAGDPAAALPREHSAASTADAEADV